jgi:tetratricopeptide (TPR) repeat protein
VGVIVLAPFMVSSWLYLQATRPAECTSLDGTHAGNVWERAKTPALRRYCDLLASGASKLAGSASMASEVIAISLEAEKMVPGRAGPSVLRGRAHAQLNRFPEAYAALKEARSRDGRAFDDPVALWTWGRAAARTAHLDEARDAYRALLPRAAALNASDRGPAYVEAGFLAMARGSAGLDEAISIFRQARHDAQDISQPVAIVGLALALDRAGSRDEARALLAERGKQEPMPMLSEARSRQVLAPALFDKELDALAAIALEAFDPAAARESWRKYLEGSPSGVWTEHARQHEAALAGKRAPKEKTR